MWQLEKYEVVIFMKKVPHVLPQPSGGAGARFLRPVEVFSGYRVFSDSLIPNSMVYHQARPGHLRGAAVAAVVAVGMTMHGTRMCLC